MKLIMALIKCPKCGKEVSGDAELCQHCGYRLKENTVKTTTNPYSGVSKHYFVGQLIGSIIAAVVGFGMAAIFLILFYPNGFAMLLGAIIGSIIGVVGIIGVIIYIRKIKKL